MLPDDEPNSGAADARRARCLSAATVPDAGLIDRFVPAGKRIVITGAGGWLGLVTLDRLKTALGSAFDSTVWAFGSTTRDLVLRDGSVVRQRPLSELSRLPSAPTWLFHFAFLTKDRAETMEEDAYRAANGEIRNVVLNALDVIGAEAVFVASSGAAYKASDPTASAAMRLYGALKLSDEEAFAVWGAQSAKRVVLARVFNVTGPYINKHQAYALASFILDGLAGRSIAVRAPRPVIRAYVAIEELLALALAELGTQCGVSRFDTGGDPLELADVAKVVASQCGNGDVNRATITQPGADVYHGDVEAYRNLLCRHGIAPVSLPQQIAKTIDYLRAAQ